MRKIIIVLVVIAVFATTTAMADRYIGSRDFGSDDAELLMRLAQSELGNASARDKASLMLTVLEEVWDTENSIGKTIMIGNYGSVKSGEFFTAVPDDKCEQAVEMIYSGWNGEPVDVGLVWAYQITRLFEFWLPFLTICFFALLFALASIGLENIQAKMLRRAREHNFKNGR